MFNTLPCQRLLLTYPDSTYRGCIVHRLALLVYVTSPTGRGCSIELEDLRGARNVVLKASGARELSGRFIIALGAAGKKLASRNFVITSACALGPQGLLL